MTTPEVLKAFQAKVSLMIQDFNIRKELIVNFDETSLHLAPAGVASFVKVGTTQVKKIGHSLVFCFTISRLF